MVSDYIQEHSEVGTVRFVGHCCDVNIGSPQTVEPAFGLSEDFAVVATAKHSQPSLSVTTQSTSVSNIDLGRLQLTTKSPTNHTESSDSMSKITLASLRRNDSSKTSKC